MAIGKLDGVLVKTIEKRSGIVSELGTAVIEYANPEKPTHDNSPIYYTRMHQAIFKLDGEAIEAVFSKPMQIQNGDKLSVAGYVSAPQFQVLAYWNQTNQSRGAEAWLALALGAVFFLAIALALLSSPLAVSGAPISTLFLLGFMGLGFYMIYRALLIRQAVNMLSTLQ